MMIRSIIFIRVLFADLLFRFRDRDISDERRRLVRLWGAGEHSPAGVTLWWGVSGQGTCDTRGRGVSHCHALKWASGGVTMQRPTLVTGSGCWISWPHTTPQWTGRMPGMWTQWRVGSSVILSSYRVTLEAGTTQGVSHTQAPLYRSQCPGQWAVTAVARPGWRHRPSADWGQSGAGIRPGHTTQKTVSQVRNKLVNRRL